ncbi:MAG: hypothetical protein ACPGD8_08835, partial [Flavobacteriales bacterium]
MPAAKNFTKNRRSLGIGITNPLQRLHLSGTGRFSSLAGAGDKFVYANNDGDLILTGIDPNSFLDGGGTLNHLAKWTPDGNSLGDSQVFDDGTNVGIGTTSPDRKLKVTGAAWTAVEIESTDASNDAALELTSNGVSNYVYTDNSGYLGLESASSQPMIFHTNGANESMRILSDGKVGIGTDAPTQQLQINVDNNGLNIPLMLRNENGTEGGNMVGLGFVNEVNGSWAKGAIVHERKSNFGIGDMHFLLNNAGNNSSVTLADVKATILGNGNFGIGEVAPAQKLHVLGNARFTDMGGSGLRNLTVDNDGDLVLGSADIGDITEVVAGAGMVGGGTNGSVTLDVQANNGLNVDGDFVQLGGALVENTTVTGGSFDMDFTTNDIDGFSVDGTTFSVNGSANRVGIGTAAPDAKLHVESASGDVMKIESGSTEADILFKSSNAQSYQLGINNGGNSDPQFYVYNDAYRLTVQNDGDVGIGTATPSHKVSVIGEAVEIENDGGDSRMYFHDPGNYHWSFGLDQSRGGALSFDTDDALSGSKMTIEYDGDVGIGTASPSNRLHVVKSVANNYVAQFENTAASDGEGVIIKGKGTDNSTPLLVV